MSQNTNLSIARHADIMDRHAVGVCWAELLIQDGRNEANWVCGQGKTPSCPDDCELHSDPHIHPNFNEWWIALDGKTRWQIGQYEPIVSSWGDIIMAPAGFSHDICPWEGNQSVRFAVTLPGSNHDIRGIAPCRYIPADPSLSPPNLIHTKFQCLLQKYGTGTNWTQMVINDERNFASITHELPGISNQGAMSLEADVWWVVLRGKIQWLIGKEIPVVAGPGDVVFVKHSTAYDIQTFGTEPSVRINITAPKTIDCQKTVQHSTTTTIN